jgi:hypothetical protein
MSLTKSKCWCSNNCLHFLKRAVPLRDTLKYLTSLNILTKKHSSLLYWQKSFITLVPVVVVEHHGGSCRGRA